MQIVKSDHEPSCTLTQACVDRTADLRLSGPRAPRSGGGQRDGVRREARAHDAPAIAEGTPQFIKDWVRWGAGPRASQYLILGAKTRALLTGRHTPDIDDVRALAGPTLRHRLVTNFNAEADGVTAIEIVERLVRENS